MAKPKILLVDDQKYFLLLTTEILEEAGFEVLSTDDVDEGVKLFYSEKPDAVVLDIVMPKEFGTEVCKDLKQTEQGKNTPIILMSTGVKEMTDGDGLTEYLADGFILKPFENDIFLGILKKQMEDKNAFPISTAAMTQREMSSKKDSPSLEEASNLSEQINEEIEKPRVKQAKIEEPRKSVFTSSDPVEIKDGEGVVLLNLKLEARTRPIFTGNSMINISGGGIFINSDSPLALGTKMEVSVSGQFPAITLKGMVVWVQPANPASGQKSGMGIRFTNQKSEELGKLKKYVSELTVN